MHIDTLNPAYQAITSVAEYLKLPHEYRTDLEIHDRNRLQAGIPYFLWQIRPTGTWLIDLQEWQEMEWAAANLAKNPNNGQWYFWDSHKLLPIMPKAIPLLFSAAWPASLIAPEYLTRHMILRLRGKPYCVKTIARIRDDRSGSRYEMTVQPGRSFDPFGPYWPDPITVQVPVNQSVIQFGFSAKRIHPDNPSRPFLMT
jgi:hypothetical protein